MAEATDEWIDVEPPQTEDATGASESQDNGGGDGSDDDWQDVPSPQQAQGAETQDDWQDVPTPSGGEWSQAGSALAGAAKGAIPVGGGVAAGLYAGAAAAGPATLAAAPLGPFAPVVGAGAGILTGLGVGMGASWLADMGQDKFLAMLGWDKPLEEARKSNPGTFDLATNAAALATLRPNAKSLDLAARGIGAAIGGVAEAGMQTIHGEGYDLGKIGTAAGMGAALPRPNALGSKIIAQGEQVGARYRGGNKNPDLKEMPAEDTAATPEQAPQEDEITVANDQPNTAAGVSVEQQAAPVIEGAGNPEGAPMAAREAARPTDPERNYAKDQPQNQPGTTESKVIDTEPLKGDIKAALESDRPPVSAETVPDGANGPAPQGTDVLPREAAPNLQPEQQQFEQRLAGIKERARLRQQNGEAPPAMSKPRPGEDGFRDNPDNHTPGVREQAKIPNSLGEIETSRAQRERVGDVQERMAASQKGEDFQGLEKNEPEPLTPAELKSLAEDRKLMAQAGFDRALSRFDALSPREQFNAVRQGGNVIRQQRAVAENAKPSEAESRREGRAHGNVSKESRSKVSTGVLARSKADALRKERAIAHVNSIYEEFGPRSEKGKAIDTTDPKAMKAYTKQAWKEAVSRNEGRDPVLRSPDQYVPLQKGAHEDAYQWLKAVKASANGQNHQSFATLHKVEGMGKLDAETGRVEGDIAHRPQIDEAGGEAETATGAMEQSRTTFEHIEPDPRPHADNSYVEDHNALADWINERSPNEYEKLAEKYDLRAEMDEPADPRELMSDMKQTLADTGKRPKGELTSEVELPPQRVKAPVLPQKEEAAPVGKVLDKNSDEFKRLAAQYEATAPKAPVKTKGEQLADLQAKRETADKAGHTIDTEAVDGTSEKAVRDQLMSFYKDDSAGGKLGVSFLSKLFSKTNPASPVADPGAVEYEQSVLPKRLRSRQVEKTNLSVEIAANMAAASEKGSGVNARDQRKIALADQDNRLGSLPQALKDHYDTYTAPVRTRAMEVMREFKDLNDSEKLGHDIPNLNAVTTKAYQPRYQIDKQSFNRKETDAFDPFTGKGVGDYSPNLEDRKFFSLENGPNRMVVEFKKPATMEELKAQHGEGTPAYDQAVKDNGHTVMIHRAAGNVQKLKNIPASFDGKLGDVLDLNVKGKKGKWTVDQATTPEIEKATGLKYYENATYAWSKMLHDMTEALENAKMEVEIKNDPNFKKLTTTDREVAAERGWSTKVSTHLPQFAKDPNGKPLFMSDQMRWVFDDYHKPGFGGNTSEGMEKLRNLNTALLKVFNTNAPLVHVLNELDLFTVGRGFKWISPKAYYDLAVAAPTAFKSVNSQDHLQAEMRRAGVNPMLASVGMRTMWPDAAKGFGMEVIKNHSQWDPVAKAWGVSVKEIGQKLYDLSSDVTWRLSDYLTTMRYLEEKANGYTNDQAGERVNKFMSDYSLKTTVMGNRALQQILADPASTGFGRFKAGLFRSLSGMTRNLLSPSATKEERVEALGQWLVMGALGYVLYPAADALVQKISGNEGGELRRRGVTSIADAAKNIATGDKDPSAMATRMWTPAPVINSAMELVKNKDFAGKPIIPQGKWPGVIPDAAGNLAEYAAKTVVPPYGAVSQTYARPEGSLGGAAGALVADQFGVGLPSDASQKRAGRIEKVNAQAEKARQKRPGGMIPAFMNRVRD